MLCVNYFGSLKVFFSNRFFRESAPSNRNALISEENYRKNLTLKFYLNN